jgi:bacterioferritin-associated ferredoxin
MEADDELCLCFHVSWRKVLNYIRIHKVQVASQLHDCGGAGTGCGWCRKQLERLATMCGESPPTAENIEAWLRERTPNKEQYAKGRAVYRESIGDPPRDAAKDERPADPKASPPRT